MKHWKWLALLLAGLLLAGCAGQEQQAVELKRVVVQRSEHWMETQSGQVISFRETLYAYDSYGNCMEERVYESNELSQRNKWVSQTKRTFDDRGNLLTEKTYDRSKWIPIRQRYRAYTYDAQNRMLEQKTRLPWFQWDTMTWEYGENHIRVEQTNGETIEWYQDDQGNTLYHITYHPDGTQSRVDANRVEQQRDETGLLVTELEYTPEDILFCRREFDDQGRVTLREYYEENGESKGQTCYQYGTDSVYTTFPDGTAQSKMFYSWGEVESHFDSQGRETWVSRSEYQDIFVIPREE